ncbi:hypothetical protein EON79_07275 [bacterium]|nr:MAG: hypothetical protein EON79_07275 [bacterium]
MSFDLLGVGRWVSAPRPGRRKGGFPPGGPWDEESFALVCALTGATEAFELDTGRLTFREAGTWAIVGAGMGELRPVGPSEIIEAKRRVYVAWARGLAGSEARATGVAHPPERENVLRILPGPQAELLGHLLDREFTVDRLSDRTGLRFSGTEPHGMEIPSEPATFGIKLGTFRFLTLIFSNW